MTDTTLVLVQRMALAQEIWAAVLRAARETSDCRIHSEQAIAAIIQVLETNGWRIGGSPSPKSARGVPQTMEDHLMSGPTEWRKWQELRGDGTNCGQMSESAIAQGADVHQDTESIRPETEPKP